MTRFKLNQRSTRASVVLAAAAMLGSAVVAGAQQTQLASTDGRWAPWVGCWQASSRDALTQELAPNKSLPVVCVIPAPGNATVDLVTVTGDAPATTQRVDANGSRRAVDREGCTGWETAQFSADAKRIYLHSEHQCSANRTRLASGIMSMSPNGEWLDVQGVKVDAHNGVRVVHYGRVPVPATLSADQKAALQGRQLATTTAVLAVADSVRIADVIDATRNVDPLVVQTWLAQRGQGFQMDAKRLTQLADAKVPSNIIDVMVALSYPQAFAINLAQADGQVTPTGRPAQVADVDDGRPGPIVFMNWDPFYSSGYYGYNGYGYANGYGYGYGGYGGNWYGGPVVIVRPSNTVDQPSRETRGRMVRGGGYTRPSDGGSSGTPRSSTSGGGSSSSGGSSSGGSSSSGGGETRTAKPRP